MAAVERILFEFGAKGSELVLRRIQSIGVRLKKLRSQLKSAIRLDVGFSVIKGLRAEITKLESATGRLRAGMARFRAEQIRSTQRMKAFQAASVGVQRSFGAMIRGAQSLAFTMTFLGTAVIRTTTDLAKIGGSAIVARRQFENTAKTLQTTGGELLPKLSKALLGGSSQLEVMRLANFALVSGLKVTDDQMVRLATAAAKLGKVTGRDTTDSFQRLTFGIVKQERRILDELGIVVRAQDVFKKFAESNNIVGRSLIASEKAQAFFNVVLGEAEKKVESFTGVNFEAASAGDRVTAAFENFKNTLAELFVTSGAAERFFGAIQSTLNSIIQRLSDPEQSKRFFDGLTNAAVTFLRFAEKIVPVLILIDENIERIIGALVGAQIGRALGSIASIFGPIGKIIGALLPFIGAGIGFLTGGGGDGGATGGGGRGVGGFSAGEVGRALGGAVQPQFAQTSQELAEVSSVVQRRIIQPPLVSPAV